MNECKQKILLMRGMDMHIFMNYIEKIPLFNLAIHLVLLVIQKNMILILVELWNGQFMVKIIFYWKNR